MKNWKFYGLAILIMAFFCTSCTVIYYVDNNPMKTSAGNFPQEMYGHYTQVEKSHNYVSISKNTLDISYNYTDKYKGVYGPGTDYPIYKVNNAYTFAVKQNGNKSNYYRIFLVEYNAEKKQMTVKEFGDDETDTAKEKAKTLANMTVIDTHEVGTDFLFNPTPEQFKDLVEGGFFRTVATFQKN